MELRRNSLKSVALLLSVLLSYETIATPLAQASALSQTSLTHALSGNLPPGDLGASHRSIHSPGAFAVPATVGSVVEVHAPSELAQMVYHFQDVHENVGAQTNLSEMVSLLEVYAGRLGKSLVVAVEGVSGPIDSDTIAKLPNQTAKEDVGSALLRAGYMLGEEYAAITHAPGRIKLIGVENADLYRQNVEAREGSRVARTRVLLTIREIHAQLEKLKPHNFQSTLTLLETNRLAVEDGSLPLKDYVSFLNSVNAPALRNYPHLSRLVALHQDEARIDFFKVEKEGKQLLQEVMAGKSDKEMERMVADAEALKEGRVSPLSYYSSLSKQSTQRYPEIQKYVEYLRSSEKIDPETLFVEIDEAGTAVARHLIKHPLARELYENLRWIERQEKFFSLNLIPQEWEAQRSVSIEEIYRKHAEIRDFVQEQVGDLGYRFRTPFFDVNDLSAAIQGARGFYEAAEARNKSMVENLEKILSQADRHKEVVAFVAGGFHTPGLMKLFHERGLAYQVIRPQLETEVELSQEINLPNRKVDYLRKAGALSSPELGTPAIAGAIEDTVGGVEKLSEMLAASNQGETDEKKPNQDPFQATNELLDQLTDPNSHRMPVAIIALPFVMLLGIVQFTISKVRSLGETPLPMVDASNLAIDIASHFADDGDRITRFDKKFLAILNSGEETADLRNIAVDVAGLMGDTTINETDSEGFVKLVTTLNNARPRASDKIEVNNVIFDHKGNPASVRAFIPALASKREEMKGVEIRTTDAKGTNVKDVLISGNVPGGNINPSNTFVIAPNDAGYDKNEAEFVAAQDPLSMAVRTFSFGRYVKKDAGRIAEQLEDLLRKTFPFEKGHFTEEAIRQAIAAIIMA